MADLSPEALADNRRKLKIVAGLGLVLAVVVWLQFGGEDPALTGLMPKAKRPEISPVAVRKERPWPKFALAEVLQHNPFEALKGSDKGEEKEESKPEPVAVDTAANALTAFQSRKVRAILVTRKGPAAMLDNDLVHEGDVVNGVRIVSIRADGLIVEAAAGTAPPVPEQDSTR